MGARAVEGCWASACALLVEAHVDAKRYLVATDPSYQAALSPGSVATLQAQGGPLSPDEIRMVEQHPDWDAAVALRRADDGAKDAGAVVADLDHWIRRSTRSPLDDTSQPPADHPRPVPGRCPRCAGHPIVRTPNLDALATEGVRFANHFAKQHPALRVAPPSTRVPTR